MPTSYPLSFWWKLFREVESSYPRATETLLAAARIPTSALVRRFQTTERAWENFKTVLHVVDRTLSSGGPGALTEQFWELVSDWGVRRKLLNRRLVDKTPERCIMEKHVSREGPLSEVTSDGVQLLLPFAEVEHGPLPRTERPSSPGKPSNPSRPPRV